MRRHNQKAGQVGWPAVALAMAVAGGCCCPTLSGRYSELAMLASYGDAAGLPPCAWQPPTDRPCCPQEAAAAACRECPQFEGRCAAGHWRQAARGGLAGPRRVPSQQHPDYLSPPAKFHPVPTRPVFEPLPTRQTLPPDAVPHGVSL
jgi:hypothetical protein